MHDYLPMIDPDSFYTCASGGLGHGLPAAVGIALARPSEKIIAILGDGSTLYAVQGLWSAVNLGLSICFVVVNNRRYEALIRFARHFGIDRTVGTDLPNVDFCAIAAGLGLNSIRVDGPANLHSALNTGFNGKASALIEVLVE